MSYTCTDDDPSNLSQQPGTVTIEGAALFDPGVVSYQEKKDECVGLYDIRQFACTAASAVGNFGEGFGKLLKDLGKQSCTQALIADGAALTPEQIGICKVDPATNAGICEPFTPTPTEPTPEEPPSLACADDDSFNDITVSGAVVITKPDQSYKSKEDFCVGNYGVIQYECAVDAVGDPIWKEVGEVGEEGVPALCPNGCAQGRCCSSGSFEYSPGLFECFEDIFNGTPI